MADSSCPACGGALPGGLETCPRCGADLEKAGRDRTVRRFRRAKLVLLLVLLAGLLLNILGDDLVVGLGGAKKSPAAVGARLSGVAVLILGGVFYARLKGRSGWWGLIGLLGCIGYGVLLWMEKSCLRCGTRSKDKVEECPTCRAPL